MTIREDMKRVQGLAYEAYLASGRIMALLDGGGPDPMKLARALDQTAALFEGSTVELRNLCEANRPHASSDFHKPEPPAIRLTGRAEVNEYGWLHIELSALLPHCRFQAPAWLTDTIRRLLDEYESRGRTLPRFEKAMLVIDEHCDIGSRQIFDQDNKGWKAIPNALKGRLLADDDQFTLSVALISTRAEEPACHIYLLPAQDAGDFFSLNYDGYPMFP